MREFLAALARERVYASTDSPDEMKAITQNAVSALLAVPDQDLADVRHPAVELRAIRGLLHQLVQNVEEAVDPEALWRAAQPAHSEEIENSIECRRIVGAKIFILDDQDLLEREEAKDALELR